MDKARAILPPSDKVEYVPHIDDVGVGCDALVVATEWPEFARIDLDKLRRQLSHPIVFDGRNLFDPAEMEQRGFLYKSVGR
jgi:UDPglucose 6-dehydrogenase